MESKNKELLLNASFKLSNLLNQKMNEKIVRDGYGMRSKSCWIKEAIEALFKLPNYIDLVNISEDVEKAKRNISIRIPRSLMLVVENKILEIRQEYPMLEGVKSKIFRTSILQRIIRGK